MKNDAMPGGSGSSGAAAAVTRSAACTPEGDTPNERIAELRRRYLEGSYKIDAAEVSAKIVDKHLEADS
jgi:anti-sigma28 factor (negative regulator of flagellin synthesis)